MQFSSLQIISSKISRLKTLQSAAAPLYSVCLFERLPQVMPAVPDWEIDYAEWQEKLITRRYKTLPNNLVDEKKTADDLTGTSAEARWQPAPLETAADRSGERHTIRRRLDQRIFMLLKKADGSWHFPHTEMGQGETTRAGAERALQHALGSDGFQPYFVGNAPAGHVALSSGTFFFHRCQLIIGGPVLTPASDSEWQEVVWAAKDELSEYIKDEATLEVLKKML